MTKPRLHSLYLKIGTEEKLRSILLDFYQRMSKDILIGFFFAAKNIEAISAKQAEFLLYAMGVRTPFTGKHPSTAHDELPPILQGHFDRRIILLTQTLKDHGLEPENIRTWIQFERAFESVIIE